MCGPKNSFAWTHPCQGKASTGQILNQKRRLPFVLDIREETFRLLDQLLDSVWTVGGLDGKREDKVPKQEQECIAVAVINLLQFQLHAILAHKMEVPACLKQGTSLLSSLKKKVLKD